MAEIGLDAAVNDLKKGKGGAGAGGEKPKGADNLLNCVLAVASHKSFSSVYDIVTNS